MKFNVTAISEEGVAPYRGILEPYNPEWSFDIIGSGWSSAMSNEKNIEKQISTKVVITLDSFEELAQLIDNIRSLNTGTDRWDDNGVILSRRKGFWQKEYDEILTITIYDGWNE